MRRRDGAMGEGRGRWR
uniref:Uncharacterized protein n=1 Tax=Arundo donax TaxID=35708 RepID=A0A0A8XR11_ARUDO